jgi:hypothetical protein
VAEIRGVGYCWNDTVWRISATAAVCLLGLFGMTDNIILRPCSEFHGIQSFTMEIQALRGQLDSQAKSQAEKELKWDEQQYEKEAQSEPTAFPTLVPRVGPVLPFHTAVRPI